MKHLILQDHNLSYMVYFRPKDKAKLYQTIFLSQQKYWGYGKHPLELLNYITLDLNKNGFKVVDISQEIKEIIDIRCEFSDSSFIYRKIRVWFDPYGLHYHHKGRLTTCKSLEEAINLIDKELD